MSFVHPNSWDWLIDQGFCLTADVPGYVSQYRNREASLTFCSYYESYDLHSIVQMCLRMLSVYTIGAEIQVHYMTQVFSNFNTLSWDPILPMLQSCSTQVNMYLLAQINLSNFTIPISGYSDCLYQDVCNIKRLREPSAREYIPKHEGLRVLHNVAPIENKIDLYFMAEKAHLWDAPSQETAQMALELPDML